MKTKTFKLHFRYRDVNGLQDAWAEVQATSRDDAKKTGKRLELERALDIDGK